MTPNEYHKQSFEESLQKLVDFTINVVPDKNAEEFYKGWVYEYETKQISDPKFVKYIENQINYYGEKDRAYTKFLKTLLDNSY